ncbi:hypothetical protein DDN60_12610 [Vibrio cholerae]|nr:hypothetical protein [Vibrio cholerae]
MSATPKSISTDEPVAERRIAALKDASIQHDVMRQFAEVYRFTIGDKKEICVESALNYLNKTFFRSHITDGRQITSYHQMQVITVSLETGLNPFNNELYGVFTPFGDLKIMATVDGWNRLATSFDIQERLFTYSETSEEVEVLGHKYNVPTWIECRVSSKEKGVSHAREFFWEVYNNSVNQVLTWSRPARTLANVSFIQALRRMLRITALSDSDVIADINRHYEAELHKQAAKNGSKPNDYIPVNNQQERERPLNIDLDKIQVIELEKSSETLVETPTSEESQETQSTKEEPQALVLEESSEEIEELSTEGLQSTISNDLNHSDSQSKCEPVMDELAMPDDRGLAEISETSVPREVLTIIKPMLQDVKYGVKPISWLKPFRDIISDEVGLKWFDQEINKLA